MVYILNYLNLIKLNFQITEKKKNGWKTKLHVCLTILNQGFQKEEKQIKMAMKIKNKKTEEEENMEVDHKFLFHLYFN